MSDLELINRWLQAFQNQDHQAMAECYHDDATFEDIAFVLDGKQQIHAMWHMICDNGIKVEVKESPRVSGDTVTTTIVDTYIFSDTKRQVINRVACTFHFSDGKIIQHRDKCDSVDWASQAFGGIKGWFVGHLGFLRRLAAKKKINKFIASHPQYA